MPFVSERKSGVQAPCDIPGSEINHKIVARLVNLAVRCHNEPSGGLFGPWK